MHISFYISCKNFVLDQDNFNLISFSSLIAGLQDDVSIFQGEDMC